MSGDLLQRAPRRFPRPSFMKPLAGLLQRLKKSWLPTQVLCLGVALFLWLLGSPLLISVVYSLLIGNFSSAFINMLLWALGQRHARRQGLPADDAAEHWPGWPGMIGCILLGVLLGYSSGMALADLLTGLRRATPSSMGGMHWWRVLGISLVPAVIGTVYFYSRAMLAAAQTQAAQASQLATETQLKLLESQLEPHMLFNTLANLRALISVDPARAQQMLDHLIDFLRATLSASRASSHALSAEFSRLADYLALMQVRMGARLQTEFQLPPELAGRPVPPLLLQPLVENAIKHGLEPQRGPGRLQISARSVDGGLELSVRDTGLGLRAAEARPVDAGGGFGLTQVRERLQALYGTQARFELVPAEGGGTLARVWLPDRPLAEEPATTAAPPDRKTV
jgi:signal transduction histidine kinase